MFWGYQVRYLPLFDELFSAPPRLINQKDVNNLHLLQKTDKLIQNSLEAEFTLGSEELNI